MAATATRTPAGTSQAVSATLSTPFTATPIQAQTPSPTAETDDIFAPLRERIVAEDIKARGITDPLVLATLRAVPRHMFVPDRHRNRSYDDNPLPIGEGQPISQP